VLGVVGTGLAYMLQFDVVRGAGATVSTTVTYLIPVVSVVLGVVVLGERLAWPQLLGAAIVLVSAVVIGLPDRRRRTASA
jgi:drug/metabolite transporter (DMT)-like permease